MTAIGESNIESDATQIATHENNCEGASTSCSITNGGNLLNIFAVDSEVDSESEQSVYTENNCEDGALCSIGRHRDKSMKIVSQQMIQT